MLSSFNALRALFLCCCLYVLPVLSIAQVPQWALQFGSSGSDEGLSCKVLPNGNVVIGGKFSNTIDLDPSAAVYNITSNGSEDMFLACYTASGSFLWGFNAGGTDIDAIYRIACDASSNVFVCGYFRGQNVDFDPSAGVGTLSDVGITGTNTPYGGDGFLAKYSATGAYQWAIDLGGSTIGDYCRGVAVDEAGNVYVEVWYTSVMDIDPSPAVVNLSSAVNGKICLAKYTPSGQLVWGIGFASKGIGGIDATSLDLVYKQGNLYMGGVFMGTADFDPQAANASSVLTSLGVHDGFLAKYDTSGHFVFVRHMKGSGDLDLVEGVTLDSANNIYTIASSNGATVAFPPGSPISTPGGGGNDDIIICKYDSAGTLQWSKFIGSSQADEGHSIVVSGNRLYCTGSFSGTVDFDPSPAVSNLVANGTDSDIFVATYDLNGNYICGFSEGGSNTADEGYYICNDLQGHLYVTGAFSGSTVDFDPTGTSLQLSSSGVGDGFLVKYPGGCNTTNPESVKQEPVLHDFALYPNPAGDEVTVTSGYENTVVTIYDVTGRAVRKIALKDKEMRVSLSGIIPGVYNCSFELPDRSVTCKKLVILE